MILKTSGGIGSLMVAPRLFDHEVLRIGTIENSSENALILSRMPRLNEWRESSKSAKITGFLDSVIRIIKTAGVKP